MITFPLWFRLFLGFSGCRIRTGTLRHILKKKFLISINQLPDDKKRNLLKKYSFAIRIHKIFVFALPIKDCALALAARSFTALLPNLP